MSKSEKNTRSSKNDIPLPAHMQGIPASTAPQVQEMPQSANAAPTDSNATVLMDSNATVLMDDQATALMQDNATALMQEDSRTPTPAPATAVDAGNGYIPPSVCGNDIINVKPLNATGGTSNLFRAHKKGLDVDVVIKRVKKQYLGRMDEQNEARIMTALRHQYLPRIYDLIPASDGYTYTIMELIEGCTLRDYVRERGSLDQKQVLKWTRQLCEVITYMHTRTPAIVHSDLKPENVMITPQGDICVIDFNASLEIRNDSQDIEAIGATPGYAAPEQYRLPISRFPKEHALYRYVEAAQGMDNIDGRTDIYAIGALAYYMITGYDPKIWCDGIIPLERYDITLGYAFGSIIEKAMSPKQADRYKTTASMLSALNNLKKYDKRYRKILLQSRISSVIIGIGLAVGAFLIVQGFGVMEKETTGQYLALVDEAVDMRAKGQYESCEALLMQALRLNRNRIEAYLELGSLLFYRAQYEEAIDLLDGITFESSPTDDTEFFLYSQGQIAYILGSCYYQTGDHTAALNHYRTAVAFSPNEPTYLRDLAVSYAKTGNNAQAQITLDTLRQTDCDPLDLALVVGEINYAAGMYAEAYASLADAASTASDPTLISRCCILAAQACQKLGADWLDSEIAVLEGASNRLGSENSILLQMLSEAYLRQYNVNPHDTTSLENAYHCLDLLITRGYRTFTIEQNTAVVLQYLGRLEEAEQALLSMQENYPDNYRIPMRLALLCADREGQKTVNERDYTAFGTYLARARALYNGAVMQDSEMLRLEDIAQQLESLGWRFVQ